MLGILRTGIRTELLYYRVEIKRGHEGPMIQQPAKEHTNLSSTAAAFRIAVLIPTFNHAKTLEKVVRGAFESTLPVIVIDDASTDDSPAIISKLHEEGLVLAHHRLPENLGKAGAMKHGFRLAREMGFTHVLSCDSDLQHDTRRIIEFADEAKAHPNALIIGCRFPLHPEQPRRNLLGRTLSNIAIRAHCGVAVGDSPCGFRVWPLALTERITGISGRYAWEEEMITRAAWNGWDIRSINIPAIYHSGEQRVSHYKFRRDWAEGIGIYALLLLEALIPGRHLFRGRPCTIVFPKNLIGNGAASKTEMWFMCICILLALIISIAGVHTPYALAAIIWAGICWHVGLSVLLIATSSAWLSAESSMISISLMATGIIAMIPGYIRPKAKKQNHQATDI